MAETNPALGALGRIDAAVESDADLQALPALRGFLAQELAVIRAELEQAEEP